MTRCEMQMSTFFDELELTLSCPVCGEETREKATRLRARNHVSQLRGSGDLGQRSPASHRSAAQFSEYQPQ
jgi:hypothetical protein